ncbi:MAG: TonB family protein, partial [Bacteroidetes bacterium]|nr:TonB family protein [Bacteroidota bacterium]
MDSNKNFYGQSMDEIVFDNRNKGYGAFHLRNIYQKTLMKALIISVSVFVLGLYSPKVASQLGLFNPGEEDKQDTVIVELIQPPSIEPEKTLPPPPPPPEIEEVKIERATVNLRTMVAVEKDKAVDDPPKVDDIKDKDIGKKNVDGDNDGAPPLPKPDLGTGSMASKERVHEDVDIKAEFPGGKAAFSAWLAENTVYPEAEEANEITGEAIVIFVVETDGRITGVRIERSSGSKGLDQAAMDV